MSTESAQQVSEAMQGGSQPSRSTTSPSNVGRTYDTYTAPSGRKHYTTDYDYEWRTGHTPCGDDDNDD